MTKKKKTGDDFIDGGLVPGLDDLADEPENADLSTAVVLVRNIWRTRVWLTQGASVRPGECAEVSRDLASQLVDAKMFEYLTDAAA